MRAVATSVAGRNAKVYVFGVTDKFGDYGITGMAIIRLEAKKADIDTFLMSCRVIGRNIEIAFLNFVLKSLQADGIEIVQAKYIGTPKNKQVESFYDGLGFTLKSEKGNTKEYSVTLNDYSYQNIDYITLKHK